MKKLTRFILFCAFLLTAHENLAQKQGNVWTFSAKSGLDFNAQTPLHIISKVFGYSGECQATIADSSGQLLFYFQASMEMNGSIFLPKTGKIYNKNNEIIENGDGIYSFDSYTNGAIFLSVPGSNQYTYLFTIGAGQPFLGDPETPLPSGCCNYFVCYHLIDNFANDGEGKVIKKNKILYNTNIQSFSGVVFIGLEEKLAAVRHANGRDWWLLMVDRKNCRFVRLLIQPQNILVDYAPLPFTCPVNSTDVYTYQTSLWGAGEMVFSPDGNKLGYAWQRAAPDVWGKLVIFDFDRCTGEIIHPKNLNLGMLPAPNDYPATASPYGLAFSPKGTKLYITTAGRLRQYDLSAPNVNASMKIIHSYEAQPLEIGQLENGPDGKIYSAHRYDGYLGIIHKPEEAGTDCGFEANGIYLNGNFCGWGLPNMPNYHLGGAVETIPAVFAGNDTTLCPGQPLPLGLPALPGYVYRWKPADAVQDSVAAQTTAAPNQTTTYTLSVARADAPDCPINFDAITAVVTPPYAQINLLNDGLTLHADVTPFDPNLTYLWNFGDGNDTLLNVNAIHHIYPDTGTYIFTLIISDTVGCTRTLTQILHITLTPKESALYNKPTFNLYPNPANENVILEHDFKNATLDLIDVNGRVVHSQNAPSKRTLIDLRPFPGGIYYVRLVTNFNQILSVKKIIIY